MSVTHSSAMPSTALVPLETIIDLTAPRVLKAGRAALRRTGAAFNMAYARFDLDVARNGRIHEVYLTYSPEDGHPLTQRRDLWMARGAEAHASAEMRKAVDEMVWNMALAFRPKHPGPPIGWSIHPAAAAIIAAAGTCLPNPADPASWVMRGNGELWLPDGGNLVDVAFTGQEGVLLVRRATIVNDRGTVVAALSTEGHRLLATFTGAYPDALLNALAGRGAASVCAVFDADARGTKATIASARTPPGEPACMSVELVDRLVPLLASTPGKERWRPRTARTVLAPSHRARFTHLLGHRSSVAATYAIRSGGLRPGNGE
ncbi:hypothetical protein [Sphingomonas sp.]|jgi:hypothetical protein|uniref:hypothetical protein n=1 Tax=Sphingomonas sp. TaxID=28214 RepID=UPI002E32B558|nr:hypothetical protein [Sphingomonas sp.]HEX4694447.1 hypothetical protein [Sphingomonas sp.]